MNSNYSSMETSTNDTNKNSLKKDEGEEKDDVSAPNNNNQILLLDGGMGHQLRQMGNIDIHGQVGSMQRFTNVALANINHYDLVVDAHLSFINAGADVITTNTYAVVPRVIELINNNNSNSNDSNNDDITLENLLIASCRAACDARDKSERHDVLVAGCLPPLAESYRPDLVGDYSENVKTYRRIVKIIAPYCDLILCETMSTALEAKAAATAATATAELPVWVSWTLDETKPVLRSGETLQEAVDAISDIIEPPQAVIQAYLVNCTSPESVTAAVPILSSLLITTTNPNNNPNVIRVGGYPNGFVTASGGDGQYRDIDPKEYYHDFVTKWINNKDSGGGGATIVGGCCGIFPKHIAYIRQRLDEMK